MYPPLDGASLTAKFGVASRSASLYPSLRFLEVAQR
jgi:hypothetical protein